MITKISEMIPTDTAIVALVSVEICMIVATNITATIDAAAYLVLYPIANNTHPTNSANAAMIPQNNGANPSPRYHIADHTRTSLSVPQVNLANPNINATASPKMILKMLIALS